MQGNGQNPPSAVRTALTPVFSAMNSGEGDELTSYSIIPSLSTCAAYDGLQLHIQSEISCPSRISSHTADPWLDSRVGTILTGLTFVLCWSELSCPQNLPRQNALVGICLRQTLWRKTSDWTLDSWASISSRKPSPFTNKNSCNSNITILIGLESGQRDESS